MPQDSATENPKGLDLARLEPWLSAHVPGARAPFEFELIAAGGSNLTYRFTDAVGAVRVLRRPPVRGQIATAHDMLREYRIMHALGEHSAGVPVPQCFAACEDPEVIGAPFYIMDFVDGLILRDRADAATLDAQQALAATRSLVTVQVAMHRLDLEAVGLADLARHDAYVARQLSRWRRQAEASKTRELPLLERVHQRLEKHIPREQGKPGLAHGDYRFDNTVLGADGRVAAVLDWELCTIGEPVADFCWSLMYWADPGDRLTFLQDPPTVCEVFPRRAEVAEMYARESGFDLSDLDYYSAFSMWKMACIVEGVYARLQQGAGGGMKTGPLEDVARMVDGYLAEADRLAPG